MFSNLSRQLVLATLVLGSLAIGVRAQDQIRPLELLLNGSTENLTLTPGSTLNVQAGVGFAKPGTIIVAASQGVSGGLLALDTLLVLRVQDVGAQQGLEFDIKIPSVQRDVRFAMQAFLITDDGLLHSSAISGVKIVADSQTQDG